MVIASVQYRTSQLGFPALPELAKESPLGVTGNYGVLDLIKASKWINCPEAQAFK
ncbi:carboxylesterase family protein [Microvirga sp. VF16]|uniref:carboxylesterase family protein n=1 Tax=Microvirga sp. VF16 TaxID=2807101 RepID=UPI00193C9CDB|nr:carboxylesterase family protein [Microvirga sp. VF16]